MIRVEELTKNFIRNKKDFEAVNGVSLEIKQGEFAAIIGHSGSGKTTLFNMIAGLIRPKEGRIYIAGQEFTAMSEAEMSIFRNENIGYVLQGQSLLNNFTILDNVCMPAYLSSNIKEFRERAMKLLEEVGLSELTGDYPGNLSGGEMRRVAIVRAMINQPKVLLVDEPTSNLDAENAHKVMQMLRKISDFGTTVLLSTHELEYLNYVDLVIKIEKGRIL